MSTSTQAIAGIKATRLYRTQAEHRRIVEETLSAGVSVATVARVHGVNANQVFRWRRELKRGELIEPDESHSARPRRVQYLRGLSGG